MVQAPYRALTDSRPARCYSLRAADQSNRNGSAGG